MKKTLTVNLGGTVFHIDDDAYRLLDNYLMNLKQHFGKDEGADEIVDDIEHRISELFLEKVGVGQKVVTLTDVEEVINRMGKPEEMDGSDDHARRKAAGEGGYGPGAWDGTEERAKVRRRLFRNPDDKILGGVCSGLAVYLGLDAMLVRLVLFVLLIFGCGALLPIYIVCWLIIPEARTAAEKLSMHGEAVTLENIGKTVTGGFEKMTDGVNRYMHSDKPRTLLQRIGDVLVTIVGWMMKVGLIVLVIVCSPVLFALGIAFVVLLFVAITIAIGGGAALFSLFPAMDVVLPASPFTAITLCIAGILLVAIPLFSLIYTVLRSILNWQFMSNGLKWTLLALWIICAIVFGLCFTFSDCVLPGIYLPA